MNREFDFIDLYYLNDTETDFKLAPNEISLMKDIESMKKAHDIVEISDIDDDSIMYTYAKFFEVLDSNGLEGLINS